MTELPKIVVQKLRRAELVSPHPDANVLAAFSERLLAESEHATVLQHLAQCSECRQIVVLALPETEVARRIAFSSARPWFTAPVLRWGAVAAAAVVAAIAIGVHEHAPQETAKVADFSRVQNGKPPADTVSRNEVPLSSQPTQAESKKAGIPPRDKKLAAKKASPQLAKARTAPVLPMASVVANRAEQAMNVPAEGMAQEQIQASAAPAPQPLASANEDVVRAKPAQMATAARAAAPPARRYMYSGPPILSESPPIWKVSADGALQSSVDGGETWSEVNVNARSGMNLDHFSSNAKAKDQPSSVPPPVFRAVTSIQFEVWAGGTNATLYHSSDAGATWTRVVPMAEGSSFTGDVNSIRFSDRLHGTISTSNSETWTTSDGGQSWQKQ